MSSDFSSNSIAFEETLELLEWKTLCEQLSTFSSTMQGRRNCKSLGFPSDISTSRLLVKETLEIGSLDDAVDGGISFHGVNDVEDKLHPIIRSHTNDKGHWVKNPNETERKEKQIKKD